MMATENMRWFAVSGSWRKGSPEVERDVRAAVSEVVRNGDGIVTGGALGVDYVATEETLKYDASADKIKIFLPTPLEIYAAHYRNRADEGVITHEQAEVLIALLTSVKSRNEHALSDLGFDTVDQRTYYLRNTVVLDASDALLAFQVNGSGGVQDTVDKARDRGMEVRLKQYTVQ